MNLEHQIYYLNKTYTILSSEQEFIIHPVALGLMPISKESMLRPYHCSFEVIDYHLYLNALHVNSENRNNLTERTEASDQEYYFDNFMIPYHGAIIIAGNLVKEYQRRDNSIYNFSYKNVYELIFEDGHLTTTIDHSKAMHRVRKNLELGLRNLTKGKDVRLIERFMKSSFVGDYQLHVTNRKKIKHLKAMKKDYQKIKVPFSREN